MSSKIEWTDETWNPTLGCTRVSSGCDNCYAIRQSRIRSGNPHPAIAVAHAGLTEHRDGRLDWTGAVNLLPERLDQPLHWRKPRRIFVDSLTDLFHEQVPDDYIARVFGVMAATPQHTYQLLTKRHGRMRSLLSSTAFDVAVTEQWERVAGPVRAGALDADHSPPYPLRNVHLGVSVEDQQRADLRIPALLDTPAAVRWISAEPLLGSVDLARAGWLAPDEFDRSGVAWLVVGGESGPGARPMRPEWARLLRDQCAAAGVPFLFKQWGDAAPLDQLPEAAAAAWEIRNGQGYPGETMCQVGKKAAGRELDGEMHDGYPAVTS